MIVPEKSATFLDHALTPEILRQQEQLDGFAAARRRLDVMDGGEALLEHGQQLVLGTALEGLGEEMAAGSQHPRPYIIDDRHVAQYGTSMSSALMAGIAALLLERDPRLTHAQFKALLKPQSAIPNRPAGAFDPHWGYGLIDMLKL